MRVFLSHRNTRNSIPRQYFMRIIVLQPLELFRTVLIVLGHRAADRRHYSPVLHSDPIPDHGLGHK